MIKVTKVTCGYASSQRLEIVRPNPLATDGNKKKLLVLIEINMKLSKWKHPILSRFV